MVACVNDKMTKKRTFNNFHNCLPFTASSHRNSWTNTANQPDNFPDFPLPSQPTDVCTVLSRNDMVRYSKMTITLSESIALEHETRQQDTSNLWHLAWSPDSRLATFIEYAPGEPTLRVLPPISRKSPDKPRQ